LGADVGRHRGRTLHLTRRGRCLVAGLLVALVTGVSALVANSTEAATPAPSGVETVVRKDDTLWRIAARELPAVDPYVAVDMIRKLNGLPDYTVHPGQHLRLPSRR
jgi:LysM repeat protein